MNNLRQVLESHRQWLENPNTGTKASLHGADLRGADLRGADLQEVNLRGADLRGADLQEVNLRGADLRGADLQEVNLRGADLRGADLRGANLFGTKTVIIQFGRFSAIIQPSMVTIGCKQFPPETWLDFSENKVKYFDHDASNHWKEYSGILKSVIQEVIKWR